MGPLTPTAIGVLLFLALLGLSLSGLYFVVEAPAVRKARRERLDAISRSLGTASPADGSVSLRLRPRAATLAYLPAGEWLDRRLQQAGMATSVAAIQLMCAGAAVCGLLVALLSALPAALCLVAMAAAGAIPLLVVEVQRNRRLSKFEEQFPEAIDLLGRAVRAGHAFTTGFELIAKEMPEPVCGEFRIAFEQQNLGLPLREALAGLARRIPSPDVMIFVSALQIQRETGGNLAEILEKLSHVIRERFKLHRQVKVFTAEGRMSLYVLTGSPLLTALLLWFVNPGYVRPLLTDPMGQKMTLAGLGLLAAGYEVIRRMVNLKV